MTYRDQIVQNHRDHVFFSWIPQKKMTNPIVVDRAKGVYFWDVDGTRYIDFSSQLMNMNIGHGHPKVIEAVTAQLNQLQFAYPGTASPTKGRAAAKLAEIAPGDLNKVLFTLGGAEAIENSIKIARQYTGRHKIVTRYRSYHGATLGAATAGGDPRRLANEPGISGIVRVHDPYAYRCPFGYAPEGNLQAYIDHVIQTIEFEGPENVAAIMMESITGSSGLIIPPDGYWQAIQEYARKHGILLICDEVMAGFGRTGKMFGIEHYEGVVPDIMTLAKGLTCGYVPLGAVIVRQHIADHFETNPLVCGLTYSGHPVGCAAALATIEVYEEDGLVENSRRMGEVMAGHLQRMKDTHPSVGDVRSVGLFGVIECVKNRETREPLAPWNASAKEMGQMAKVAARIRELGMHTFVRWNWIFTVPPLCITEAEMEEGFAIIDDALNIADEGYIG
ncbi:MAG: aspartate aminotransferase family protein [Myxococcales bacterium]|nr:aspartate aminotransferase family protein [Myxococcales bacterium]